MDPTKPAPVTELPAEVLGKMAEIAEEINASLDLDEVLSLIHI